MAEDSIEGGCSGECALSLLAEAGKGAEDVFDVVAVNSIEEEVGGSAMGVTIAGSRLYVADASGISVTATQQNLRKSGFFCAYFWPGFRQYSRH